jgi:hypothetical protein
VQTQWRESFVVRPQLLQIGAKQKGKRLLVVRSSAAGAQKRCVKMLGYSLNWLISTTVAFVWGDVIPSAGWRRDFDVGCGVVGSVAGLGG